MRATSPLSDADFASRMAALGPFEPAPLLAVAVSGGPDSMALAWLASRWAGAVGGRAVAVLVDHRLRRESAAEVACAAAALETIGVAAVPRTIAGAPPDAGRPAWARAERYRLLIEAAREIGALHLLLGHHLDDQAETVLLNLARGSGVKGLAAMRPIRAEAGLRLLRPLLDVPKARLVATAAAAGLPTADDPSNRDPAYARTRARRTLAGRSADAQGLAAAAARLAEEDMALEAWVAQLAATSVSVSPVGLIRIDRARLVAAPQAVALRLLARASHAAGGRLAPPRQARAADALDAVRADGDVRRTLGGALVRADGEQVRFWREATRLPGPIAVADIGSLWDGRFRLRVVGGALADAVVAPLGYGGLCAVEAAAPRPDWAGAGLPRAALATLPGLWREGALLAAPRFDAAGPGSEAGLAAQDAARLALTAEFRPRRPLAPMMPC